MNSHLITIEHKTRGAFYEISKRLFDCVAAGTAIVLLAPALLFLWLLVKLDDGGPLFYSQTRVGRAGRHFKFWKFRSMRVGADAITGLKSDDDSIRFKAKDDPRITRVGKLLRRSSLDELPQLWNVLRGDMSLVGPRPALPQEVAQYNAYQRRRLNVDQGITCLWQIAGRALIPFERQVELDLEYIRRRSFCYDLWIVLKTVPAVLSGRGAY